MNRYVVIFKNNENNFYYGEKMKTLVIHPEDESTDFLENIYSNIECTVIGDEFIDDEYLRELIEDHDRIIMLGHGCPSGLFGGYGMIIDESHVPLLIKKEVVAIWCNADQFIKKYNLKGYYTGMFISEVQEASIYGIIANQRDIDRSNYLFATLACMYLESDMMMNIKEKYDTKCPVVDFNRNRLYSRF